jgi:hypothetical protein
VGEKNLTVAHSSLLWLKWDEKVPSDVPSEAEYGIGAEEPEHKSSIVFLTKSRSAKS